MLTLSLSFFLSFFLFCFGVVAVESLRVKLLLISVSILCFRVCVFFPIQFAGANFCLRESESDSKFSQSIAPSCVIYVCCCFGSLQNLFLDCRGFCARLPTLGALYHLLLIPSRDCAVTCLSGSYRMHCVWLIPFI